MSQNANKYRITTNVIEKWITGKPKEIQRSIRWLHNFAKSNNFSVDEIGTKLKQSNGSHYSGDSVYQLLSGRRTVEQMSKIIEAVQALEKIERERQTITRAGFVETNLTKKIFQICDSARNFRKMMFLIGPSHIGKSTALLEYARRNNSGATIYLRAPAGGGKARTLYMLAEALNLPTYGSIVKLEIAILNAVDDTQIILVDEATQLLHGRCGLKTLGFFRELHDTTNCGMVYSATEVFDDAMMHGPDSKRLNQTNQRHLIKAKLPKKPTRSNLNDFASHFGLAPAQDEALDLQTEIIRTDSLGRWCSILEGASRIANRAKEDICWNHVLQCHAALLDLETI
jgi:DNA transposition AAA+ family ATPase